MPSVAAPATATPRPYPQPIRVPASEIAVLIGGRRLTVDEWSAMPPPCARNENATTDRVLATRS